MANERKLKLTLDGEKEFKSALNSISLQTKALNAEMKAATASFDKNTTAEEKNRKTTDILDRRTKAYQTRLDTLSDRIAERTEKFGENSDYVNRLKTDYYNTETAMSKMADSVKDIGDASDGANESSSRFFDVLSANVVGGVIVKGLETLASKLADVGKQLVELGFNTVALADDLNTLARQTGLSTDTLQRFRYASAFVDVEESTLTGSLTKLTRNMYSAADGTGTAADAFKTLGVDINNADGSLRPAYDVFLDIIDALGGIGDATTRDGLAMQIFGKSAQELNPLIMAGSGRLAEYAEQAANVGYIMDTETLSALNAVNDEVDAAKLQFERLKNQIGVELRPVVHEIVLRFTDFVNRVDWEIVGQIIYTAMMTVVGAFMAVYTIIKSVIDIIGWLGETFERIPETVANMSAALTRRFEEIKSSITSKFTEMINNAKSWGKDMIDGFIGGIKSKIGELIATVSNMAGRVRAFLHFSKPDVGPLRDYETWFPDMIDGMVRSLNASSYKLTNAVAGMAAGVAGGVQSAVTIGGITINGVADESQIDNMVNMIERKLGARLYR